MYLVFKSTNAASPNNGVYGVEFCNGLPSFVTKESDMIYTDIGDGTADAIKTKVNQILANIDEVTIKVQVNVNTSCNLNDILVGGDSPDRKIDPDDWKTTVKPAWYRAAHFADHSVI